MYIYYVDPRSFVLSLIYHTHVCVCVCRCVGVRACVCVCVGGGGISRIDQGSSIYTQACRQAGVHTVSRALYYDLRANILIYRGPMGLTDNVNTYIPRRICRPSTEQVPSTPLLIVGRKYRIGPQHPLAVRGDPV